MVLFATRQMFVCWVDVVEAQLLFVDVLASGVTIRLGNLQGVEQIDCGGRTSGNKAHAAG